MPRKETSPEISAIASKMLRRKDARTPLVERSTYNELLAEARQLAASALSQDETKGRAPGPPDPPRKPSPRVA